MNKLLHHRWCLALLLLCFAFKSNAQTTVTTGLPSSPSSGSGANYYLTFILENTNGYAIQLTNIDMYRASTSNGNTYSLFYSATSLSGSAGLPSAAWTKIDSVVLGTVTTTAIHPAFTNMSFVIPANTVYRFAVQTSGSSLNYGGSGSTPNSFSNGGLTIGTGDYQINGLNVGYWGNSTNPRFWCGSVTFIPAAPCTAPPTPGMATANNLMPCMGSTVQLSLTSNSAGLGQTYQWQTSASSSGPWTDIDTAKNSPVYNEVVNATAYYRAKVKCGVDSAYSDSVLLTVPALFPGGTYTIDPSQPASSTNFQTFAAAVSAISCGISGPIVFNVANDTFTEQAIIPSTVGSTATKTVTFNGNGAVLTSAGSSSNYATLALDGADHISFDNLTIEATGSSGFAVHLSNSADSNTFSNCTINASPTGTGTTSAGVVMSASLVSYSASGANGSHNSFSYCHVNGGYFGMVFYGSAASSNEDNSVTNCHIQDYYVYGLYNLQQSGATIANDTMERPNRATVSTFYGIMLSTGCNGMLVEKNVIRNAGGASGSASFTAYCIYNSGAATAGNENKILNNLIYNIGNNGTVGGIYMPSGTHVQVYHNTISLDNTAASTGTVYGIYSTGSSGVDIENNNVVITQGAATKYGLYFSGANRISDHNNIYVAGSGTNSFGYYSAPFATLSAWQTANGGMWDASSVSVDPLFVNLAAGDLTPTSSFVNDKGAAVGVATDINGAARSVTTPDPGAIEFTVPACFGNPIAGTATSGGITTACPGSPINLILTGYTSNSGITVQWEESPAGVGIWTPINGATSPNASAVLTTPTDYRAMVTCVNGGGSDISNTINIGVSPFYVCYCSPLTGVTLHTSTSNYVTNVAIPGTTLNSTTSAVGAGGYTQTSYTVTTNTATLAQGVSYTIEVTTSSSSTNSELWIDWNQNGTFDTSEYVQLGNNGTLDTGTFMVPLSIPTGLTGLRIRNVFSATTFFGSNGACDNISVGRETEDYVITIAPPPSCFPAGTPSATAVVATSATLEWTASNSLPANGYEWRLFPGGSGPTGTPLASGTEVAGDTIVNLSALTASTAYSFFVRAVCGPGNNSLWAFTNFTTPCAAYNAPWMDSVESQTANTTSTMTNCWSSNPSNQSAVLAWNVTGNGTTSSASTGPSYANSGVKYFFLETSYGTTNASAELFTPQINVATLTAPMLEFYYHMYGATTNKLVISVHNGTTWNDVDSIVGQQQTSETAPWMKRSVYLTGYTGIIQVRFTGYRGSSFTGDISIDDISVSQAPSCPSPTNPTATTTMTSASLNWTENGSATQWQIEYGSSGFAQGTGTSVYVSSKPYLLSGLTHSTEYSFFVRSICGPNDTSTWSPRHVFATIPNNDTCSQAINIGGGQSTNGTTAGATESIPAGSCATTTTYANDVWYYFSVGNTPGTITITATNTVGDVVLEVFSGVCGALTELDCEDVPAIGTETITLTNPTAGIYYVRVYGFQSSQNPFTVQVTGTPLVIKLLDISAIAAGERNRVDWKTADEAETDRFTVERSYDGKSFMELSTINANGFASNYTYWDEHPVFGINYYRLKMADAAGHIEYSKVVMVSRKANNAFHIEAYPNPTDGVVTLSIHGSIGIAATITITDLNGRILKRIDDVTNFTSVDLSRFSAGVYIVKYHDDKRTEAVRLNRK